jgi:hypothetical protein
MNLKTSSEIPSLLLYVVFQALSRLIQAIVNRLL